MKTRKKILLALAHGCVNTRQIANFLNLSYGTVNNYFYESNTSLVRFVNGELAQWVPGKSNTLRLGPLAAIIRGEDGRIENVGMVADMDDLEASFNNW